MNNHAQKFYERRKKLLYSANFVNRLIILRTLMKIKWLCMAVKEEKGNTRCLPLDYPWIDNELLPKWRKETSVYIHILVDSRNDTVVSSIDTNGITIVPADQMAVVLIEKIAIISKMVDQKEPPTEERWSKSLQ